MTIGSPDVQLISSLTGPIEVSHLREMHHAGHTIKRGCIKNTIQPLLVGYLMEKGSRLDDNAFVYYDAAS